MTPNEDIEPWVLAKGSLPSASYIVRNPQTQDHQLDCGQYQTRLRLLHLCTKRLVHQCKTMARRYSDTAQLRGGLFFHVDGHQNHASWVYAQAAYPSTFHKSYNRSWNSITSVGLCHGTSHLHKDLGNKNLLQAETLLCDEMSLGWKEWR